MNDDVIRHELHGTLNELRRHVLGTVEGLSDEVLTRPAAPSGWSMATMVKHLANDVERYWFGTIIGGEPLELVQAVDGWSLADGESAQDVIEMYRTAVAASDAVFESVQLSDPPRQRDPHFDGWQIRDVLEILVHVIQETATHTGHLDLAREHVDGRQWIVL